MYMTLKNLTKAEEIMKKYGSMRDGGGALPMDLILAKAQDEYDNGHFKAAAELYHRCGETKKAIEIASKKGYLDLVMDICRSLDRSKNKGEIELCVKHFRAQNHHAYAKQGYLMLDDIKSLMSLNIECHKWEEAQILAKHHPHLEAQMWLPYADFLSSNDRFEEAQEAYKKAKRPDLSLRIIEFLAHNAVSERRFQDAAQFYWIMAAESLRLVKEVNPDKQSKDEQMYFKNFDEYTKLAQIYQAYNLVHKFIEVSYEAVINGPMYNEAIFNASRFLVCAIQSRQPMGISKVYIFYALSFLGTRFEAFKTARFAYEKLQGLKIPPAWQDDVDLASLKVKAKPYSDKEGFNIVCNRCMHVNSLINLKGDYCSNCAHAFCRNYVGFDTLPLVEFVPRNGIPFKKVIDLLKLDPPEMGGGASAKPKPRRGGGDGWNQDNPDEQTMAFNQGDDYDQNELFDQKMLEWLETQVADDSYKPVEVDEQILTSMRYEDVFIVDYSHLCPKMPKKFYKSMVPDIAITLCPNCCQFFLQDEFEFAYQEKMHCPFCKHVCKDKQPKQVVGSVTALVR